MGRDHEKRHTPGKINLLGPYVINFLRYRKRSFELRKTPECIWPLFTQSRTSSQSQGFIPLVRTLFKESTAHHPDIPKTWSFLSCIFAELGLTPRQEFMQFPIFFIFSVEFCIFSANFWWFFFPDFAPNSRKEWRLSLFNQICENKLENCRKFWNLWKLFDITIVFSIIQSCP